MTERAAHMEIAMFRQSSSIHQGPISGVAASRGLVATAGYDGIVGLWEARSHRTIGRACHDHLVNQCDFSPDGTLLATASSDHSARIWSVPQLKLATVLNHHHDDVLQATFSPRGDRIATCSYDGTIAVSTLDGTLVAKCVGHVGLVERFAWSADGTLIASCGTDGSIRVWDPATGEFLFGSFGLETDVDDIVHLDGDSWIAGTDSGDLLIVNPRERRLVPAHDAGIKCLSRAGDRLLTTGYDQRFALWKIGPDTQLRKVAGDRLPSRAWARSGCFLGNSKLIFASFGSRYLVYDLDLRSWNERGYEPSPALNAISAANGHVYAIGDAGVLHIDERPVANVASLCNAVAPVGDMVLVAGQAGTLFDALTEVELYRHEAPINRIELVAANPDGQADVVLGAYDGTITLLSLRERRVVAARTFAIASSAIKGLCARDGIIFCGAADGSLTVVDARTGQVRHRAVDAHDSILNDVSFCPGGFVTVSRDLTMRLWTREATALGSIRTRHSRSVKCVCTSGDSRYSASGSYGGTIDVFDHATGAWSGPLRRPTMAGISSIAWCPEHRAFLAASYDGQIYEVQADGY